MSNLCAEYYCIRSLMMYNKDNMQLLQIMIVLAIQLCSYLYNLCVEYYSIRSFIVYNMMNDNSIMVI